MDQVTMHQTSLHQVVFLFQQGTISLQLLVEEFESLLDGFAPLTDYANTQVNGVYAEIRADLSIEAAVFFNIGFDAKGFPEPNWNVPFKQLSRQASPFRDNPKLYRVSSREQCSIPWHQKNLWQPSETDLAKFEAAVFNNRLKLGQITNRSASTTEVSNLTTGDVEEPQLLYDFAEPGRADETRELPFQRLLQSQKRQIEQLSSERVQLIQVLQKTRDTIKIQIKLRADAIAQKQSENLNKRIDILKRDLDEYRRREQELLREVAMLEQQNQYLVEEADTLSRLEMLGVRLQLSLSGEGQISIPFTHVDRFTLSPQQYFSDLYNLEVETVERWWEHAQNPRCQHLGLDKQLCQKTILVEQNPRKFRLGFSDRCDDHKTDFGDSFNDTKYSA